MPCWDCPNRRPCHPMVLSMSLVLWLHCASQMASDRITCLWHTSVVINDFATKGPVQAASSTRMTLLNLVIWLLWMCVSTPMTHQQHRGFELARTPMAAGCAERRQQTLNLGQRPWHMHAGGLRNCGHPLSFLTRAVQRRALSATHSFGKPMGGSARHKSHLCGLGMRMVRGAVRW